jgi:flagellar FliJ protein
MAKLAGLIRLKKHELDQYREELAKLESKLAREDHAKNVLLAQIETEKNLASVDIEASRNFGAYLQKSLNLLRDMERQIQNTHNEIFAARRVVQDAFMEVKKLDITEENRAQLAKDTLAKKISDELDDIGITVFQRGQGDSNKN